MTPTMSYPKRLIEVDLPIKRISAHARREKSIRHGHISTLHIWWARRPLAACRAVILAALFPDPADPDCPPRFLEEARKALEGTRGTSVNVPSDSKLRWDYRKPEDVRAGLLDFIAEFANWDNATNKDYLAFARHLVQVAHESLGGAAGTRPLVVDPFAGGGSIPLEALRVGADAFASDLNPVAVLLNKVVLEYIPKYGQRLADEVRKWGTWIKEQAEKELSEFYPRDPDGATPTAYLWARTIRCEGPGCGAEVPLIRSLWLAKKGSKSVALQVKTDRHTRQIKFAIIQEAKAIDVGPGTVQRGSATCPVCGYTTPVVSVRRQLKLRHGGTNDARMTCVVTTRQGEQGRRYRLPTPRDHSAVQFAQEELEKRKTSHVGPLCLVPDEAFTGVEPRRIPLPIYGMLTFADMFTSRQLLSLTTYVKLILCRRSLAKDSGDKEFLDAVQTCLALVLDRCADKIASLVVWHNIAEKVEHVFGRQAIPMVWDFADANPLSDIGWGGALVWVTKAIEHNVLANLHGGQAENESATRQSLPDDSADALVSDPPYYYSVPYADLSDFFYVWLKRTLSGCYPNLFSPVLTPKEDECIQNLPHAEVKSLQKTRAFYEMQMKLALEESRRVAKPSAIGIVVFAHTDTDAWESLLSALHGAGWVITSSWPIDTELTTRLIAKRQSSLSSSVHLVCRPRENPDASFRQTDIGDWREILQELPRRIHAWLPRLAEEGVVGADAIFACLGPALEIFSRYSRVEKASGEVVALREYLEQVWAAVAKEALSLVFRDTDTGVLEPDARVTAMWLWMLKTSPDGTESGQATLDTEDEVAADEEDDDSPAKPSKGGFSLEFDAARKIAQGLGAHLEDLTSVVEVKGQTARLLPVGERLKALFGKDQGKAPSTPKKARGRAGFLKGMEDAASPDPATASPDDLGPPKPGATVLDRVHQAMLLFGLGHAEALKRFVVDDGAGSDPRFWKLAQSFSALYPPGTEEKRWVDGVLARKKGLGF
jgi:putative DNA methylase